MTSTALNKRKGAAAIVLGIVVAGVFTDLLAKLAARNFLAPAEPVAVLPGLNLTLGYNPGVAFGLLPAGSPLGFALMIALQSLLSAGLVLLAFRAANVAAQLCFMAILAGAMGNLADRMADGTVTDFLDVYVGGWHWPTFNLADALITMGAAGLIATEFFTAKHSALQ